jgi:hypothetical protein
MQSVILLSVASSLSLFNKFDFFSLDVALSISLRRLSAAIFPSDPTRYLPFKNRIANKPIPGPQGGRFFRSRFLHSTEKE